jgi:peptide/nickel transport system permease protein
MTMFFAGNRNTVFILSRMAGIVILLSFGVIALAGPFFAPYDPKKTGIPFLHPSALHFFGTNDMGYDLFSEWIYAARTSLLIGVLSACLSVFVGGGVGIVGGYMRGWAGEAVSGLVDVFLLIPMLPLMVVTASYLGPGYINTIFVISLLCWCSTARAVIMKVHQLRKVPFLETLRVLGFSKSKIIVSHIVPHVSDVIAAKFTTSVAAAMASEAALSFIGLGDPSVLSWGGMIHYAFHRGGFSNALWAWFLPPGLSIGLCSLGFLLAGGGNMASTDSAYIQKSIFTSRT